MLVLEWLAAVGGVGHRIHRDTQGVKIPTELLADWNQPRLTSSFGEVVKQPKSLAVFIEEIDLAAFFVHELPTIVGVAAPSKTKVFIVIYQYAALLALDGP